jgi:cardiolipin synthase
MTGTPKPPKFLTVPNQLTFLRLGFLPLFLVLVMNEHYKWALAVLLLAAVSDGLDGWLARHLNQRTALGAYLDPIADKLLLSSSFLVLSLKGKIVWWLTTVVLTRDVLMLTAAVVIILVAGYRPFPPTIYGKWTTFLQILMVFATVTQAAFPALSLSYAPMVLKYAVAAITSFSGLHYSVIVARRLSA